MRYQIISLKNPVTSRRVFLKIAQIPQARLKTFREVAQDPKLQRAILAMIGKQPTLRNKFVSELAKNPKMLRTILKLSAPK
jgi:hypothetical protein